MTYTKYKIAYALIGVALLLEGGMWASNKYHFPQPARMVRGGQVELGHCPFLTPVEIRGRPGDVHNFDIPAGQVPATVRCFSVESGLGVGWGADEMYEHTAAVKGQMTALAAFTQMLASTDLAIVPPKPDAHYIEYGLKEKIIARTKESGS